jgi:hypothetical protein
MTKLSIATLSMTSALLALGCDAEGGDDLENRDGTVRVVMHTPAPEQMASPDVDAPVDDIWIHFDHFEVHEIDGGWISIHPEDGDDDDDEIDDEVHFGDMPLVLAEGELPEGDYDQLRLIVADASIYVDGVQYPLEIPSGQTSGFKIHGEFCVHDDEDDDDATDTGPERANPDDAEDDADDDADEDDDDTEELHLHWDTQKGVRHSDQRGYWLVPSVQLEGTPGCGDHEGHDHDDDEHDDDEHDDDEHDE